MTKDIEEDKFLEESEELAHVIIPYVPWIKEQIETSTSKITEISYMDIRKKLGPKFEKVQSRELYDLVKFVLFHEAIVVEERENILIMRNATVDDRLPPHLEKYFGVEEIEMTRYEKIIKKSKEYATGERYTTEIIAISRKLLPKIEDGIEKSDKGTYVISMKDMMSYIPKLENYNPSLESIFCILSSVLWPHYISTDISYDPEDFCLHIIFSKPSPREEEPSIENCTKKWMVLYEEI